MWSKRWWFALMTAWSWLLVAPTTCLASGFALFEAGARSTALAGAVVARADDLSAIFYNPAGLVQLPGFQVMAGSTFIFASTEIVSQFGPVRTSTRLESTVPIVPHFFASYQACERLWLGLGLNSPFGLGVQYPDNWSGNINVTKASLQTINFNPTMAVKINEHLSAAAGLDIMYLNLDLNRVLPLPLLGPQSLNIEGHTWGLGFNLGLQVKPLDYLSIGISYRSQIRQQINGVSHFQPFNGLDADASGSIILPDMILTGIMVRPLEKLSVEAGVVWTHWSLFRNFDIRFANALGTLSERKEWHDTWRAQLGVEYRALPWLDLRGGYAFENEPMPDRFADYLVPTTDQRHSFCFGTGFRWQAMTIDLAYSLVYMPDRTVNNSQTIGVLPSTYRDRLHQEVILSLGYKF
jgi:long-chain fatty acid transport protein